jgi:multiple RNA-binding domain-containing protein 1
MKLKEIFSYYGHVVKVMLPETKAIGLVEFESKKHALNAFKNLSYFIHKNEPLYLEWAPLGLLE